jgi:3-phenylpropionate/cinnamic acid dioxygenase small subunit
VTDLLNVRPELRSRAERTRSEGRLTDLYARYAELLDAGEWDDWLDLFSVDCRYTVVSRENVADQMPLAAMRCESREMLADRVHAVRELQVYRPRVNRHLFGPIRVIGNAEGRWQVRANYAMFESVAGEPATVASTGRFEDVVVVGPHGLLLQERCVVYDAALIDTSMVFPL